MGFERRDFRLDEVLLRIFYIKKEESKIFENAQNYLWPIVMGTWKKIFSPIGQDLIVVFLGRMKNQKFSKNHEKPRKKFFPRTRV